MAATRRQFIEWRLKSLTLDLERGRLTTSETRRLHRCADIFHRRGALSDFTYQLLEALYLAHS